MSIIYKWDIININYYPNKDEIIDLIHSVNWKYSGTDTFGNTGEVYGVTDITHDTSSTIIPFGKLSPDIISGWIEKELGVEKMLILKGNVSIEIDRKINPPIAVIDENAPKYKIEDFPIPNMTSILKQNRTSSE